MKKSIAYKLIGLALIIVGIVACDTATQDISPVVTPDGYTKATFTTGFSGSTVNEGDTIVYHVEIDKMLDRALTFNARVVEGTGNEDDITVISGVLQPYTDTTTVKIIFNRDWSFEPTETMKIEIGVFSIATRYLMNKTTVNPILNLSVTNFVSDTLTINFDWSRDVDVFQIVDVKVNVGTYYAILRDTVAVIDNAANIDFDVFISEAAGFDILDPWSSSIVDAAATGNCPEVFKIIDYPDGEYIVWSDLYANNIQYLSGTKVFFGYKDSTQLALGVTQFIRQGSELDWNMVPDSTQAPFIYSQGYDDDGTIFNGILGKFIVAAGKYTVVDYAGTESGPWKSSSSRKPRPTEFIKNKR
jgi:hypothetical protein